MKNNQEESPSFQVQSFMGIADDGSGGYYFGLSVIQLKPRSRGSITVNSSNFLVPPQINANFLSDHDEDLTAQLQGLKQVRALLDNFKQNTTWLGDEVYPGSQVQTDDQLLNYIKLACEPFMHPAGTCQMGISPQDSGYNVVDPDLRVWGVKNLRIADSSIMPCLPSANTNATAMVIGALCAQFMAQEAASKQVEKSRL